jgi:hypothetical protein
MTSKSKFRPSPALVISCLALFLALTGSALAAKASIGSNQIVNGSVRTVDLRDSAVNSAKVADTSITANDLGTDSAGTDEIAKDAVNSDEVAENAVTSSEVAADSLTVGDLASNSVASPEIADQTINSNDIGPNAVNADELSVVTQRTNSTQLAAGANGSVSVPCQQGEQILSGGGAPSAYGVEMTSNAPSGNGWFYAASNKTGAAHTITVYALCLS